MDIKTRFDVEDKVFFLTTDDRILNFGKESYNKPYVCEAIVDRVNIDFRDKKLRITYTVKTRDPHADGWRWVDVEEDWCAPDLVQLGQNVTNRFRVNAIENKSEKKKRR